MKRKNFNFEGVSIFEKIPEGWKILENATTAPNGYVWVWNVKSHFGGEYRHGLYKLPTVAAV